MAGGFCKHCGNGLEEGAKFCTKCGNSIDGTAENNIQPGNAQAIDLNNTPQTEPGTNPLAIAGLILAFIFWPVGLVLSIVALTQISSKPQKGKGLAIAGIVISLLIIPAFIIFALVITTFSGIQQKSRDTKRQTDIRALHSQLEAYYAQNGTGYPSLADVNTASWRLTNMPGLESASLCDPSSLAQTNCNLAQKPASEIYSYQLWQFDGTTPCTANVGKTCPKYTLTATLEGTINGSDTYEKQSLN
jgi:peptidyl-prolyl cis-trans isomerase B (cyclophilin B)